MSTQTTECAGRTIDANPACYVNHIMRKDAILHALVEGIPGRALCGERFIPESRGGGDVGVGGAETCPACEARFEELTR